MPILETLGSAGLGWVVGKVAEAVTKPLGDELNDAELNAAIMDAIKRSDQTIRETFSRDAQTRISELVAEHQIVLFTTILERLKAPSLIDIRGGLAAELARVLGSGQDQSRNEDLARVSEIIDAELWCNPPLDIHRARISAYIQEKSLGLVLQELVPDTSRQAIKARVSYAAAMDAELRLKQIHGPHPIIQRHITQEKEDADAAPEPLHALLGKIKPFWRGALEDQGGAGKSTALLTLSTAMRRETPDTVLIYLPISDVAKSTSVFEALLARRAFISEKVSLLDLTRQASDERLHLALDGWNELSVEDRKVARARIRDFAGQYPAVGLLFATRPSSSPLPQAPSDSYALNRLYRADQIDYVTKIAGAAGRAALQRARASRDLSGLLGIPFFLSIFARLPWQDGDIELPKSRADLVAKFVEKEFERPVYLDAPIDGSPDFVRPLLTKIAVSMIQNGSVELGMDAASSIIRAALMDAGLQNGVADVKAARERLSEQSLIHIDRGGMNESLVFDHQLLRDWFGSLAVRNAIASCSSDSSIPCSAVTEFGNIRNWEGAVSIAVEALSEDGLEYDGVSRFAREMCGIDARYAAVLLGSFGDEAWRVVEDDVVSFVDAWRATGAIEPFSFMVGIGRDVFADRIFEDLRKTDPGLRERELRRRRLNPQVLGPNWKAQTETLPSERQRMIVHDLAYYGGEQGLEMAIMLAANASDTDHLGFVMDEIEYRGRMDMGGVLLDAMSADAIIRWIDDGRLQSIAKAHASLRFREILEQVAKDDGDRPRAIRAQLTLAEFNGEAPSENVVSAGLEADRTEKDFKDHFLHLFFNRAPAALSRAVVQELDQGREIYRADRYLLDVSVADRETIFRYLTDPNRNKFSNQELAKFLTKGQLRAILNETIVLDKAIEGTHWKETKTERERLDVLIQLLNRADPHRLIQVLINTPVDSGATADFLCQRIKSWKGDDRGAPKGLPVEELDQISVRGSILRWCAIILEAPDRQRGWLANGISALAQTDRASTLPLTKALITAEVQQHEKEKWDFDPRHQMPLHLKFDPRTGYSHQIGRALAQHSSTAAKDFLLGLIGDEKLELEAAGVLRKHAPHPNLSIKEKGQAFSWPPENDIIRQRRDAHRNQKNQKCHPIAARILDRIAELNPQKTEDWPRVRELATHTAVMECGSRLDEIIDLIQRDPEPHKTRLILQGLASIGVPIEANWVLPGLEAAEAEYFGKDWVSQDDFYILDPWLKLLAQSDAPIQIIDRVKAYPKQVWGLHLDDYVSAIMLEDKDASIDAILALCAECDGRRADQDRIRALSRIGTDRAYALLLDDVIEGKYRGGLHFIARGTNPIAAYLERDPSRLLAIVHQLGQTGIDKQKLQRLGVVCSGVETDLLFNLALEHIEGPQKEIWRELFANMIEGQCVQYEATGHGSFNTHQKSVGHIRRKLYQKTLENPSDTFWRSQLQEIERIIADYGGHPDDERHPDLAMTLPYPDFAGPLWTPVPTTND